MTAVYDRMTGFFGIGGGFENIGRGFSSLERAAERLEVSAVNAAGVYSGILSISGQFSDILRSAAAINTLNAAGAAVLNGYPGGGEFFSADRKGINAGPSAIKLPYNPGISGGIAIALQYTAAIEAARDAASGTLGTLGLLGAVVDTVRNNTSGAYDITLSFGGLLGGTMAVALAALGNSVIWLRKLCTDSILEVGNSAAALAVYFGGMWNEPLSLAAARFMLFGNSALSVIGSVASAVGSVTAAALSVAVNSGQQKNIPGSLGSLGILGGTDVLSGSGEMFFGGNSFYALPIFRNGVSPQGVFGNLGISGGGAFEGNPFYAPPISVNGVSSQGIFGGLSEVFYGGNTSILKSDLLYRISPFTSTQNNAFSQFPNQYFRYDQAFAAGYLIGDILTRSAGIAGKSGDSYSKISSKISSASSEKIASEVSKITESIGTAAAASEVSAEDLKFLRDIAARDVINRFTTAQVSVSMGGVTNNLSGTADIDGIIDYLANGVKTAMENAAEGVHS